MAVLYEGHTEPQHASLRPCRPWLINLSEFVHLSPTGVCWDFVDLLQTCNEAGSEHNIAQALLTWLDSLTEELEACDAKVIEKELQQTVETALRMQGEHSTSCRPALRRDTVESQSRRRQQ